MKNKKLLITLGCSLTEGVGCYDLDGLDLNSPWNDDDSQLYVKSIPKFHEYGYPNELGRLLNYDKVINLGIGGGAPLSNVKHLFEMYSEETFQDYDVLLFWMIPNSDRTSYYFNGSIESRMPYCTDLNEFDTAYINKIMKSKTPLLDATLEVVFGIKSVEQFCENKGINLLLSSANDEDYRMYKKLHQSKYYLSNGEPKLFDGLEETEISPCRHPNKKGYKKIAIKIFDFIKKEHYELINTNLVDKFEWEYLGNHIYHRLENDEHYTINPNLII